MATISVNINIDRDLKDVADRLFHNLGLSFTSAVTTFLRQVVKEQGLPLSPAPLADKSAVSFTGKALTEKALMDSLDNVDIHGPFNTFAEMMADINADS